MILDMFKYIADQSGIPRTVVAAVRRGGPDTLQLRSEHLPPPQPTEVQVEVEVAGVAFGDLLLREGLVPGLPYPRIPGYDAVGRVTEIGRDVVGLRPGDRVAVRTESGTGGYASALNASADLTVPIPDAVSSDEAAAVILNYVTAWQMLTRVTSLVSGSRVLVHGASGGVGRALVELAQHLGLRVVGTSSSTRMSALAGRVEAFDRDLRWERDVLRREPEGVQAVFDGMGGSTARRSLQLLAPGGALVEYGVSGVLRRGRRSALGLLGVATSAPRLSTLALFSRGISVAGYASSLFVPAHRQWFRDDLSALLDLLATGSIAPAVEGRIPLDEAARAHELLARGVGGKVLLEPAAVG